ncbi:TonB-dependent receptor plug domain-containing protein [Paludibacter sp.]
MLKLIHRSVAVIAGLLLITTSYASADENPFISKIANRFSKIWLAIPQEKVYLHTDKPYYYSAGDDLWFSAYLVNASTHQPNTQSRFVYVELIDKSDSLIYRVKVKRDSLGIAGKITLSPTLQAGEYELRAYTHWMQNISADFFFHKKLYVGNMIDDRVQIKASFGNVENGKLPVSIKFTNSFSLPITDKTITVKQNFIKRGRKTQDYKTNQQGEIFVNTEADSTTQTSRYIEISINEPGLNYSTKIQLPNSTDDFDVQFFPESGILLDQQIQTIGFKAIGSDGLSREISGKVFNQNDIEIGEYYSINKGMGKMILQTIPGEKYYTLVTNTNNITKKFELPPLVSEGIGLKINNVKGKVYFKVFNQSKYDLSSLYLMVHSRGVVYFLSRFNEDEGFISEKILPSGICSFSVIDSLGHTWCERLSFIRNDNFPVISMKSDKSKYGKRELVGLNLNLISNDSVPIKGSFSVSVTDMRYVGKDSINDNILSYLLLSSDLKGYIEEPQQYFYDNSPRTQEKTDLLMLTHGWKRFRTEDIVKGQFPPINFYLEAGQSISGKVLNLFGKPSKLTDIIFLNSYKNQTSLTKTDSLGQFLIEGIDLPDSTSVFLKAKSKSKIVDVEIMPDTEVYPATSTKTPLNTDNLVASKDDFFTLSKERYYNEGGMLVVNLEEFTVKANQKSTSKDYYYSGAADNSVSGKQLEAYNNLSVMSIIGTLPGVMVFGDNISIRGAAGDPLFMIDGMETEDIDFIRFLNGSDIEEISLFKGPSTAIFGSRGGNGVIAITLKKGISVQSATPPSLVHLQPLGYQKNYDFYVPKYEVDSIFNQTKPDLRTTIFWSPKLKPDSKGNIQLQFFTADKANDYRVELEGISVNGEICKFEGILKRE